MSYSLLSRLGRGGMGVVDLAVDRDGQMVALKRLVLHGSELEISRARLRVRREAEALGALDHPHIVALLDVVDEDDDIVLVMPYLSGGTLADRVANAGPMPPAAVDALADELLGALAAAHRAGIVHRDIKPANVLFDGAGVAFLADFGVATMRGATSGLTATEVVLGTPEYMAPEQARGESATAASDVFSLGATLRYAVTGAPPFGRGDPRVIVHRAAAGKVAPLPREVPRDLRRRLDPMLARRPESRPTAAAARRDGDTGVLTRRRRRRRGRSRLANAFALAALCAIALGVTFGLRTNPAGEGHVAETTTAAPTTTTTAPPTTTARPAPAKAAPPVASGPLADTVDGQPLLHHLEANLVPDNDVDHYPIPMGLRLALTCELTRITLTAPDGVAMRLDILDGKHDRGSAVSRDGRPASVRLDGGDCSRGRQGDLVAQVSWQGSARSSANYQLDRSP